MAESDADLQITRVFVSGLPPSFKTDQLTSHFGKKFKVTDAHVFPDRRIAFVGFNDAASAQNAVKYFNRSYVRMSRISVDLAKPVEVKHDSNGQSVPVSQYQSERRARGKHEKDQVSGSAGQNDTETAHSSKRKRDQRDDGEQDRAQDAVLTVAIDTEQKVPETQDVVVKDTNTANSSSMTTDNDWLRGKTSRLLDLVTPDEMTLNTTDEKAPDENKNVQADRGINNPDDKSTSSEDQATEVDGQQKVPNARLFIRNLAFDATEADLEQKFGHFGKIQELHIARDARLSTSKGMAFVQFSEPANAEAALKNLDGSAFHGRLLHILPASDKRDQGLTGYDISKMPLKKQKAVRRKMEANSASFSWNSLYMNPDAVIGSIADRLGVSKSAILDPTSADAAVKQAHAETQLIAETKDYLRSKGIVVDNFKHKARDESAILLKNFPFGTSEGDLRGLLEAFGNISHLIFPPAGTIALVRFNEPYSASQALKNLAYKNIKGSVLYLEKAPLGLFDGTNTRIEHAAQDDQLVKSASEISGSTASTGATSTVFVRNLNFSTTTSRLIEVFSPLSGFLTARVKTRTDPKRPGEILSMGFGFVEFSSKSQAEVAVAAMSGHRLDGHELIVKISTKSTDLAEERRRDDTSRKVQANQTKIIIKNLPFQASKKDVRSLFAQYGQLRTLRVPKKLDNSSRGFAFAEFITAKEAENAMSALSNTHLLGRRLVLELAAEDSIDPEEEIRAIEKKVEQQSSRMNASKLLNTGRKKFIVGADEDPA